MAVLDCCLCLNMQLMDFFFFLQIFTNIKRFQSQLKFLCNMSILTKGSVADELTCSRRKVKDKYGQDTGEDAGDDDVDDVEERLPLDDEVEGDVLIQLLFDVFPGGFVTNGPFSILCKRTC